MTSAASENSVTDQSDKQKLRLLILGWMVGSGSTGVYISELAAYLSRQGHDVVCLSAGRCDWRLRPYLAVTKKDPFELIELRNPPIMAGSRPQNPRSHIESPVTEAFLGEVLDRVQPAVVAIIDFPGWPASTVELCQRAGSRVLFYLQNFWPFCTRLSLHSRWHDICYDFQGGARCVKCMETCISADAARWRNRVPKWVAGLSGIYSLLKRLYRGTSSALQHIMGPEEGQAYAERRAAYVHAVNRVDMLVGISRGSILTAGKFGVRGTVVRHFRVGYSSIKALRDARGNMPEDKKHRNKPLRFAYVGAVVPDKGVETLMQAFHGIPKRDAILDVYGKVGTDYREYLKQISDPDNLPTFHGWYDRRKLPILLSDTDVAIVPSNCEDTLPTTVSECHALGIPVIGSRVGGIPEQITEDANGLLVEPGNSLELRVAICRVVEHPDLIDAWRKKIPSDFDPAHYWQEFEAACCELTKL